MREKRRHRWDMLAVGEFTVVPLPVRDLVHIQERFAREQGRVFSLRDIDTPPDADSQAQYTIVTRTL